MGAGGPVMELVRGTTESFPSSYAPFWNILERWYGVEIVVRTREKGASEVGGYAHGSD